MNYAQQHSGEVISNSSNKKACSPEMDLTLSLSNSHSSVSGPNSIYLTLLVRTYLILLLYPNLPSASFYLYFFCPELYS